MLVCGGLLRIVIGSDGLSWVEVGCDEHCWVWNSSFAFYGGKEDTTFTNAYSVGMINGLCSLLTLSPLIGKTNTSYIYHIALTLCVKALTCFGLF